MQKNTLKLLIFEWLMWVLAMPMIILIIISIITGDSFVDLFFSLLPGGSNVYFSFLHLIIIGLIIAPVCSYYGFLTRPLKKLVIKTELEKDILDKKKLTAEDKKKLIQLKNKIQNWKKEGYNVDVVDKKMKALEKIENTKSFKLKWNIILIILTIVACCSIILVISRIFGFI